MTSPKIILVFSTTGYEYRDFVAAAGALGIECIAASDRCHVLGDPWGDAAIALRFEDPDGAAQVLVENANGVDALVPVGDQATVITSVASAALGLRSNSPESAAAARDKYLSRTQCKAARLPVPEFRRVRANADAEELAAELTFPCVIKPLRLSASRGVMRADDGVEFVGRFARLAALLDDPQVRAQQGDAADLVLIEEFVDGVEVAYEGIVTAGELKSLALFDKPDALTGPFFAETIYVTPSRLPTETVAHIDATVGSAVRALGLYHGPIHAEVRLSRRGPVIVEIAARSIGGLCSRALTFDAGISLPELILQHAVGGDVSELRRIEGASGVAMLPVPAAGTYKSTAGVQEALAVVGVEGVEITAKPGQQLVPLPEGSSYLGFVFARAETAAEVEQALRTAVAHLHHMIMPTLAAN